MSDQPAYHLNIIIDSLTNSIRDTVTGKSFATKIIEVEKVDLKNVSKKNKWHFNWGTEFKQDDRTVYKLIIVDHPETVQGLVSITNAGDHYYLHLAESAPSNFGKYKCYEGVGGNLFAYCCKLSWDSDNEGVIAFKSKTVLINHYIETLGAVHVGGHNMVIYPKEALILINKYFKE